MLIDTNLTERAQSLTTEMQHKPIPLCLTRACSKTRPYVMIGPERVICIAVVPKKETVPEITLRSLSA